MSRIQRGVTTSVRVESSTLLEAGVVVKLEGHSVFYVLRKRHGPDRNETRTPGLGILDPETCSVPALDVLMDDSVGCVEPLARGPIQTILYAWHNAVVPFSLTACSCSQLLSL